MLFLLGQCLVSRHDIRGSLDLGLSSLCWIEVDPLSLSLPFTFLSYSLLQFLFFPKFPPTCHKLYTYSFHICFPFTVFPSYWFPSLQIKLCFLSSLLWSCPSPQVQ
ncbi:hypothetical protein RJT34_10992 [Clitoria ternatea]|uniref:Uncharacterized protein n=1 Tax=Clitoria ternatea TaxID=43366 RepID=A0AAN9PJ29_CLITE